MRRHALSDFSVRESIAHIVASIDWMLILAISGSLRALSSNTALLQAAALVAPPGIEIALYSNLGQLPHFNPDLDGNDVHPAVTDFRQRVKQADAVIFSVPEYAHGLPGVLKNALDWAVGSGEFVEKPVALFNASPRGTYAQGQLTETLTVMTARVLPGVTLPLTGNRTTAEQIAADPTMAAMLREALDRVVPIARPSAA
jgi:NAD(P)H-dependent FMN reductase